MNAPVASRNRFTEDHAKSRIEKMGFTNDGNLKKDDNGVWRGRAMKHGKTLDISVDYPQCGPRRRAGYDHSEQSSAKPLEALTACKQAS